MRKRADPATYSTVGWNCMNSMSRSPAPARQAAAMPSPVATGGLVVSRYTMPQPPLARTVCRAHTRVGRSPVLVYTTAPTHAPS